MKQCIVCGKEYTNPGRKCNSCRNKAWKVNNRERDLAQRSAYNKRRWAKVKPIHSEKKCKYCGKVFMPNKYTPNQPYCSAKCRVTEYRLNNKELIAKWAKSERKKHKERYWVTNQAHKDKVRFSGNRLKALERDGWVCQKCGTDRVLAVHHKDFSGQTDNPNNRLDNLTTLCAVCHLQIHEHWIKTLGSKRALAR